MTYTKKQVLPALHHSGKVNAPDMPDVEDKNYTATILKYANLALPFPQLHTNANTIVAAINELYAHPGGSVVIPNPPIGDGLQTESGDTIQTESGESIETEQGGGGGSVVGPLNSISIDGDIYTIEGGGGTSVVANPTTEPNSAVLSSLGISGVNYNISGIHYAGNTILFKQTSTWTDENCWNVNTLRQSIPAPGVTSYDCVIFVSPAAEGHPAFPNSYDDYIRCGIRAVGQSDDWVTFQCDELPDDNILVHICYFYTD